LQRNSTCFRKFLCPSSGVIHFTLIDGICHTGLYTVVEENQDGTGSCTLSKVIGHRGLWKAVEQDQDGTSYILTLLDSFYNPL
jgi:hypothetical protein